ncbi:hypothetical protein T440DRAFT_512854 [Plenodomus tracheiphilus IPT5]|uniref:Zn(2)-C6 fungal-type domain-containing protein n=1 Tax=Plenodomus tracheiphilus IPT5 TaxID=1408161 RepID=A0A6A7BN47_9PLEO|nr:hypothetical protein T440DRAFT_512854 [Plenodomus tracheiphilus IPT5]
MATEHHDRPDKTTTAAAPRKRALVSCDRCKVRRARCIRENPDEPCADCKASGVHCESKLPRKQRVYGSVETLSLRYRALESLIKGLFPHENTQDVNVLFNIAAARNIQMPAPDDYTPANIFSNTGSQQSQATSQHEQQPQTNQDSEGIPQRTLASHSVREAALHYVDTPPAASSARDKQTNPFSESYYPTRYTEEFIPTRHGVPYHFGPSSCFSFSTTIRIIVARYQAISGVSLPRLSHANPGNRLARSTHHGSTTLSDEEYLSTVRDPSDQDRLGRKRSRAQMEETSNQWEPVEGSPNPSIIGDLLPSRSLADALVAAYFDHIHIHLPLFHKSMFQFRLEATYSRKTERLKDCADIGWLVALALVFSFGCQQLQEHDPVQAHKLRLKYLGFAKSYFRQLTMTTSLINVQALVLLNLHHHTLGQKSSSWLLIGLAARMAITMNMHRPTPPHDTDPIEQTTRQQVFWSIYISEKTLCCILGRPTTIDDTELCLQTPETPMLENSPAITTDFMTATFKVTRLAYRIRQRAYFDPLTGEEREPEIGVAEQLLRECDGFFAGIPMTMRLDSASSVATASVVPLDHHKRILLLHVYYYYTRCIVSRGFLLQKVEAMILRLGDKTPPTPTNTPDWPRTLTLAEDCVDAAHKALECILQLSQKQQGGVLGISWLGLWFVNHAVMVVCADFLARDRLRSGAMDPEERRRDGERKEVVRRVLRFVKGLGGQAPVYRALGRVAVQFAWLTGVLGGEEGDDGAMVNEWVGGISDVQDDWFADAVMDLGGQFWGLSLGGREGAGNLHAGGGQQSYGYSETQSTAGEVEDWTARTLRGLHTI